MSLTQQERITKKNIDDILYLLGKIRTFIDRLYIERKDDKNILFDGLTQSLKKLAKLFENIFCHYPRIIISTDKVDIFLLVGTLEFQVHLLEKLEGTYTDDDYDYTKLRLRMILTFGHHILKYHKPVVVAQPRGRPRKGQKWDPSLGIWVKENDKPHSPKSPKSPKRIRLSENELEIVEWLNQV